MASLSNFRYGALRRIGWSGMSRLRPWQITWSNETFKFFNVSSSAMAQMLYWSKTMGCWSVTVAITWSLAVEKFISSSMAVRSASWVRVCWRVVAERREKYEDICWEVRNSVDLKSRSPFEPWARLISHATRLASTFPSSGLTNVEFSSEVGLLLFTKTVRLLSWSQRPSLC